MFITIKETFMIKNRQNLFHKFFFESRLFFQNRVNKFTNTVSQ